MYLVIFIFYFIWKAVLKSLHDGMNTSLAAAEENAGGINRIIVAVTIIVIVVVFFAGVVLVWLRIWCRARERLSQGVMSLFADAGVRPNNQTPPFSL